MRPRWPVALFLVLLIVGLSLAFAGWLPGPPAEANASPPARDSLTLNTANTDICPLDAGAPLAWSIGTVASALRVVSNPSANEYAAFGLRYDDGMYDDQTLVGWRVDASGAPLGSPVTIGGFEHQATLPVVAFSPASGHYLAVTGSVVNWNTEHAFPQLEARLLQSNLAPLSVRLPLGNLNPQSPAVAYDVTADEFLVVWVDEAYAHPAPTAAPTTPGVPTMTPTPAFTATPAPTATAPPREVGIYAARIRGDGTVPPGGETRRVAVLGAAGQPIGDMQLAYNSVDGEYLAVWTRGGTLYSQRVSRAAEAVTAPAVFGAASSGVSQPLLAYNSADNQYLVVWSQSGASSGVADVVGMVLSGQAVAQGAPFVVQATPAYETPTDLAYNPVHDEYLLSWTSSEAAPVKPTALRLAADGSRIGNPIAAPLSAIALGVNSATGDALLLSDLGHRAQRLDFAPCAATPTPGAPEPPQMIARTEQWFGQALQVHEQHNGANEILFRPLGGNIVQVFRLPFSRVDDRLAPLQDGAMVWLTATRIDTAWNGLDDLVVLPAGFATPTPGPTATATPGPSPTLTLPNLACPRPDGTWLTWPEGRNVDALRLVPHAHGGEYLALTARYVTTDTDAIVGQRLALSGESLAAATDVLTDTLAARPAAAYSLTADRTLLVWGRLVRQPTHSASHLLAQAIGPDLAPLGPPVELGSDYAYDLSVAHNPDDDEFLVVWREERRTAPSAKTDAVAVIPTPLPTVNQGIYALRVRTDGTPIGSTVVVAAQVGTLADGQLTAPRVEYNSHDHEYLVVWGNSRAQMFTRRVGRAGALPMAAATLFEGWGFELAYNSVDNEYLLAYLRVEGGDESPGSGEVMAYARRLTAGGASLGEEVTLPSTSGYAEIRALAYNADADEYLAGLRDRLVRLNAQGSLLGQPVPAISDVLALGVRDGEYLVVERWGYLAQELTFQPHCAVMPTPDPGAPTPTVTPSAVPGLVTWQGQVQAIESVGDAAAWTVEGQTALVTRLTRIETYAGPAEVGARVAVAARDQGGRRVADVIVVQPSAEPSYRLYLPLVRRAE